MIAQKNLGTCRHIGKKQRFLPTESPSERKYASSFLIMLETSISLTGTYSTCGVSILKSILRSPSDSQVALENLIIREYQAIILEDAYSPLDE